MKEIQQKANTDLFTFIAEQRAEIRKIHFGTAGSGMRDTRALRKLRKDIARGLTEVRARAQGKSTHNEA